MTKVVLLISSLLFLIFTNVEAKCHSGTCGCHFISPFQIPALLSIKRQIIGDALQDWLLFSTCQNGWTGVCCNNFGQVTVLDFTNFNLKGKIALEIGSLFSLQKIIFLGNKFDGLIPHTLGNLKNLKELNLMKNSFYGPIPSQLGDMDRAESICLAENSLSGSIPSSLGKLKLLKKLYLGSNKLTGFIPSSISDMTSMEELYCNNNSLSGVIPFKLGLLKKLTWIHFEGNFFSGKIPSELLDKCGPSQCYQGNCLDVEEVRKSDCSCDQQKPKDDCRPYV